MIKKFVFYRCRDCFAVFAFTEYELSDGKPQDSLENCAVCTDSPLECMGFIDVERKTV